MKERIAKLRKQSIEAVPHLDITRARLITEAYKLYDGSISVPEMRAKAFYHYMEHRPLCINEGELIVGEKGDGPQGAPTFPELCCHTLEDMTVMDSREKIFFKVSRDAKRIQEQEIIPYWQDRSMRTRILKLMDDEWMNCYRAGLFTEFMEQRGPGHTVGGDVYYKKGFIQLKAEILHELETLDYLSDMEALKKRDQLKGMAIACDGIMLYAERYRALALEMAKLEENEGRRKELEQIAENCRAVPNHAPTNYFQALQMYWFIHIGVTTELNPWDAFSPGRLDQHLFPFYIKDIEEGRLNDESALELLECLWIKFNNQPAPPKVGITLKESSTYTDFANINTGGIAPDGHNGVNAVSYLILDCMDEMRLLQPSSNVQISRKTPQKFLLRALEIAGKGWGQPAFYNTEAIVQELLNAGKSMEDARRGGASGCVETGSFGNEAYILTGYFNLPKILEITLNDGYDPISSQQLGPHTGKAQDFSSYDQLFDAYAQQVNHFLNIKIRGNNIIEGMYAENMPVPFLSTVVNDCIKRGCDYKGGGARYNTNYIQGVGIGTITDCLAAIKFNVYQHKHFTMQELITALESDFDGHQRILALVSNRTPKYGNDDDYADDLMKAVFELFRDSVSGRPNLKGGKYGVQMLPTTCHVYFGEVMGASPNGRRAFMPVSEGISPDKGADRQGPTAVLKSCSKMDHLSTGGTLLNQKFSPSVLRGEQGLLQLSNLVRTYFNMDGHHIQFNVVDRATLLAAQKDPEQYKDLIVRVAGYSDHFHNLDQTLQDEIIQRTEQSLD